MVIAKPLAITLLFIASAQSQRILDTTGIKANCMVVRNFSVDDSVIANPGTNEWWRGKIVDINTTIMPYTYKVRWCSIPDGLDPETTIGFDFLRTNSIVDCFNVRGECRPFIRNTRGTYCKCGWSNDGGNVCAQTQIDPEKFCGDGVTKCPANWDVEELSQVYPPQHT